MKLLKFSFIFFVISFSSFAKDSSVNLQFAGEIGKYSIGVGHRWSSWFYQAFHYGVVPKSESITKIETYALKNNFSFYDYEYNNFFTDFYFGVTAYYVPGSKYETDDLDSTPNGYYRQSSYRIILALGFEVVYDSLYAFYFETGVNDVWLINYYNNDSIEIKDHVSLALGFRWLIF